MSRKLPKEDWLLHLMKCGTISANGCHEWQKARLHGYGIVRYKGHNIGAHRLVFMLANPHINIDSLQVNHLCDNRACINPLHLYAGTQKDNVNDMTRRGRGRYLHGSLMHGAKLSEQDIPIIRQRLASGESSYRISKDYPVDPRIIMRIGRREKWAHIP